MRAPQEEHRVGLNYLADVTLLLQRIRLAHPTAGLFEPADLQWWWAQRARPTDQLPQLFWFDEFGVMLPTCRPKRVIAPSAARAKIA
jgi:hypothetical protein